VIIDGNPLEDVRRTDQIDKVMLNGRLYDAATLAEEGQGSSPAPNLWWRGVPQFDIR
jgi:hypothetical protein